MDVDILGYVWFYDFRQMVIGRKLVHPLKCPSRIISDRNRLILTLTHCWPATPYAAMHLDKW